MDPFVGEVRIFTWDWAPRGWALCNGAVLPANQNYALYSLLGNTFGGSAPTTFALPDLRGRTPVSMGRGQDQQIYAQGQKGGAENVGLTISNMPMHNHYVTALAGTAGNATGPKSGLPATVGKAGSNPTVNIYAPAANAPLVPLAPDTLSSAGGNMPHNNMQPYMVVNFCIATSGIYPPRQ